MRKCLYSSIWNTGCFFETGFLAVVEYSIFRLWILFLIHPNALLLSESLMILAPSDERPNSLTTVNYIYSHMGR